MSMDECSAEQEGIAISLQVVAKESVQYNTILAKLLNYSAASGLLDDM